MTIEFKTLMADISDRTSHWPHCGCDVNWEEVLSGYQRVTDQYLAQKVYPADGFRAPIGVQFEVTYRCNLKCIQCYNQSGEGKPGELSAEEWYSVARQAGEIGVMEAVISGGEPFLRKEETLRIMEILDSYGVYFILITNGWFVDKELVDQLKKFKYNWVQVSIDGARPEIHDSIRGVRGSWERAVKAVYLFLEAGLPTTIAHVLMRSNFETLEEMIDLAATLGVVQLMCDTAIFTGRAAAIPAELELAKAQREEYNQLVRTKQEQYRHQMVIQPAMDPALGLRIYCAEPSHVCLIRPNGDIKLECMTPFVFGNVQKNSLAEIWERGLKKGWEHPEVLSFIHRIKNNADFLSCGHVPHLDADIRLY